MLASRNQRQYLADLIEAGTFDYPTLQTIWDATPENNKKYPIGLMRKMILADRLMPLLSYEANYIINMLLGKKNKYNKDFSTKQAFQYLANLNLV